MRQTEFLGLKIYEEDIDNVDPTATNDNMEKIDKRFEEDQERMDILSEPWNIDDPVDIAPAREISIDYDSGQKETVKIQEISFKSKHFGNVMVELSLRFYVNHWDTETEITITKNGEIEHTQKLLASEYESDIISGIKYHSFKYPLEVEKNDIILVRTETKVVADGGGYDGGFMGTAHLKANFDTPYRYFADDWSY